MLLVNIKAVVLIITAFFDVLYIFYEKSLAKCDCSGYNRIVELTKMCWQGLWYLTVPALSATPLVVC